MAITLQKQKKRKNHKEANMNGDNTEQVREKLPADEEVRMSISVRAYEIYLSRGGEPGGEVEDWLQAENEVLTSLSEERSLHIAPES